MSDELATGRSAFAYRPVDSPAVLNVTTYTFGADPESTRSDTVRRIPSAAIVIHRRGRLLDCHVSGEQTPLPEIALLGPSTVAHFWATRPNTEFLMVNLAPGATRKLFDIEPADILNQVETLKNHELAGGLQRAAADGAEFLHGHLCRLVSVPGGELNTLNNRSHTLIRALRKRIFGGRVRNYADHFGMTCRTMQRHVRAEVGLTPKHIVAIERMRSLVKLTAGGWTESAANLAQAGGFFDQSHLRYEVSRHQMGTVGELVGGDHIVVRK